MKPKNAPKCVFLLSALPSEKNKRMAEKKEKEMRDRARLRHIRINNKQ